jgi:hypothetical protein
MLANGIDLRNGRAGMDERLVGCNDIGERNGGADRLLGDGGRAAADEVDD